MWNNVISQLNFKLYSMKVQTAQEEVIWKTWIQILFVKQSSLRQSRGFHCYSKRALTHISIDESLNQWNHSFMPGSEGMDLHGQKNK